MVARSSRARSSYPPPLPACNRESARQISKQRLRPIRKHLSITLLFAVGTMLTIGSWGTPATAEPNPTAVIQNIDKTLKPATTTWDEAIAPQLAKRDADLEAIRVAEEAKRAAEAAGLANLVQPSQPLIPVAREVQPSGSCASWMVQAGITDPASAYQLIMRESGCNPNAVNISSGACGIGQQLPCGKWSHTWNEPVGAMIDMQNYVVASYGSWANALAHSYAQNWY